MFRKILIANRGEIACRIIATARRLGVATVAVYSDADAQARHVALADEAVLIGGAAPAESYLRADRILEAACATGAEAIHPGYGFLSENPEFAEAVAAAGLVFIGPSAAAIRAMGLKDAAKALMAKAGVPVVPGTESPSQDPTHLRNEAARIGYPVLIKAVAGGGGKGMRLVPDATAFDAALASAQGEAATAFGNASVLVEKYVETPRHIEIQIFGDGTRAVHLHERDCSLQRRHQKVIEEAPAPGMTPAMRAAMGQAAVRAAEAIGYSGAGTVEFIVDARNGLRADGFWFMEMNTRLQVEHPVTEAITGIDLVEWQLRVAAGEPLPLKQDQIPLEGHAFEARLYAEDVPAGFLPATGRLVHLRLPESARIETGVRAGDDVSPWYDPMIAKIITHGPTRAIALRQLEAALAETEVAGCVTNLGFLGALARHEGFARGDVDTGLIARDLDALVASSEPAAWEWAAAAALAMGLETITEPLSGFSLSGPIWQPVPLEGAACELAVTGPRAARLRVQGKMLEVRAEQGGLRVAGAPRLVRGVVHGGRVTLFGPVPRVFVLRDPLAQMAADLGDQDVIIAPMPGIVKAVMVAPGAEVAQGAALAILEAMKMEHTLTAARAGRVAEVLAAEGAQVTAGQALVRLAPEDEE